MNSQNDTLTNLADELGVDGNGPEFGRVWQHLLAEAWTSAEVARDFRGALKTARKHLQVVRRWPGPSPAGGKRKTRGSSTTTWRDYAAALERRAADLARSDEDVLAFRRDILDGGLVNPTHADVQRWLREHPQYQVQLTKVSRLLSATHGWIPHDALVFVLTNETPPRPPFRVQMQFRFGEACAPRIMIEAESWMPPAQVARAFRDVRDRMLRGTGTHSRRRARAISPQAVALVAFIERTQGSWRERLDAWNAANPKGRFTDRANFRRAYEAARRRLVPPTNIVAVTRRDGSPQPVFYFGS